MNKVLKFLIYLILILGYSLTIFYYVFSFDPYQVYAKMFDIQKLIMFFASVAVFCVMLYIIENFKN